MHLYLIRHGQSYVNLKDWADGNVDAGLTPLGQRQAAALAAWLPTVLPHIDALYASTMQRARETAAPLAAAYGCPILWDDRLREIGNNRWDHSAFPPEELPRTYPDYWASERPFATMTPLTPGGETFMHFRTRVGLFIEELVECCRGKAIVAVCHGGVVEAAFDHIFNIGPWRRCEVWHHNTGVTHFEYVEHPRRETWRLHYHNRVDHLRGIE
ncbi:MAG: histidine phosphatase family protein [Caldilineales bacterium]|nr:histidine phosphatase family protein [Caldilineales bacterium]MDW8319602.1 histidine phosphatase family protein [Anaerolineae bacterium]